MSPARLDPRSAAILSGPIPEGVLKIALPSVATMLLMMINNFLDRWFLSGLGTDALAAIVTSGTLLFTLLSAAMAISTGTSALVGRFVGEGEREDRETGNWRAHAEKAYWQSLLLGGALGAALGLFLFLMSGPLLRMQGLEGEALEEGQRYLRWAALGLPFSFLMFIQSGAFRGLGDTVRPFWVTLGGNVVHILFNLLLIQGNLGFPKMGVAGGAMALNISGVVGFLIQQHFLRRGPLGGSFRLPWRLEREWMERLARIGLPAGGQNLLRTGSLLLFQNVLAHNAGPVAVAAMGVGLIAESIAFMPGFGYSIAASAFVGQNLGAGNPKRASDAAWQAAWQAMAVMSLMGVVFVAFARPFAGLFVHLPADASAEQIHQAQEQIRLVVLYLQAALVSEPFLGLAMVLAGALQGAGETVGPTVLVAVTAIGIRLPLAYVFLKLFGIQGAWWAMTLSTVVQGIFTALLFRTGRWQETRV